MLTFTFVEFIIISIFLYIGTDLFLCGLLFRKRMSKRKGTRAVLLGISTILVTCGIIAKLNGYQLTILLIMNLTPRKKRYFLTKTESMNPEVNQCVIEIHNNLDSAIASMRQEYEELTKGNSGIIEKAEINDDSAIVCLNDGNYIKWKIEQA